MKVEFAPEFVTVAGADARHLGRGRHRLAAGVARRARGVRAATCALVRVPGATHWIVHEQPALVIAEIERELAALTAQLRAAKVAHHAVDRALHQRLTVERLDQPGRAEAFERAPGDRVGAAGDSPAKRKNRLRSLRQSSCTRVQRPCRKMRWRSPTRSDSMRCRDRRRRDRRRSASARPERSPSTRGRSPSR